MLVGRCVVGEAARRGDRRRVHRLAAGAPIQHAVGFAVVRHAHEIAAATARFSLSAVHRETAVGRRSRDALDTPQVGAQHLVGEPHELVAFVFAQLADSRPRAQLARPQQFAAIHVADSAHHALVEQHFGHGRLGRVVRHHAPHALVDVGRFVAQVGAELAENRMSSRIKIAVRLHHGRRETHRDPICDADHHTRALRRLAPSLARVVHVPRTGHPHVRVQDDAVVPHDLEMLAATADFFDGLADARHEAFEPRRLESHHLFSDEGDTQRCSCAINRVAFGHVRKSRWRARAVA